MHRHAIVAQALSLTHLGICFSALGVSTTALQYHLAANTLLAEITQIVPGFVPHAMLSSRTTSANSHASIEPNFTNDIVKLKAAIASNVGIGWQMSGDFMRSIEWHKKSLRLYEYHAQISDRKSSPESDRRVGVEETRQNTQLAAMYCQLGGTMSTINWIKSMKDSNTEEYFKSRSAKKYWLPPFNDQIQYRDDDTWRPAEHCFDYALSILYKQAYRQRIYNDWTGLFTTYLNIGIV